MGKSCTPFDPLDHADIWGRLERLAASDRGGSIRFARSAGLLTFAILPPPGSHSARSSEVENED